MEERAAAGMHVPDTDGFVSNAAVCNRRGDVYQYTGAATWVWPNWGGEYGRVLDAGSRLLLR